jgi:hypothetical protein
MNPIVLKDIVAAVFDLGVEQSKARNELREGQAAELREARAAFDADQPLTEEHRFDLQFFARQGVRAARSLSEPTIDAVYDFLERI